MVTGPRLLLHFIINTTLFPDFIVKYWRRGGKRSLAIEEKIQWKGTYKSHVESRGRVIKDSADCQGHWKVSE